MRIVLNRLKEFARDRRGNFAIMFAVLGTTLLMGTALAVDTARMFSVHNKLTFAVDAAALATTQGLTLGDIADIIEQSSRDVAAGSIDTGGLCRGATTRGPTRYGSARSCCSRRRCRR